MKILIYNELIPSKIKGFNKLFRYLEQGDFKSAEVKKVSENLYRARLDHSNRLLFSVYLYDNERYLLLLEHIQQHAYEKSRFLQRGVTIDEAKIPAIQAAEQLATEPLSYLNPDSKQFNILDKIISFDQAQESIYRLSAPLILIGSAGSGKTALTLEKMKETVGDILYLTRSPYLTQHARNLYYANGYQNSDQQIDFLCFEEYLETIQIPAGREITLHDFNHWFSRQHLQKELNDSYQVFEEIKGVLTGSAENHWLNREEYLSLGIKQSIFNQEQRTLLYDLFEKYLTFLDEKQLFDSNIISFEWLKKIEPRYDFIVIDEVQDLTTVQLQLVLKSLHKPLEFFLCGDSNQIVHPNFFSWSNLKSHFYQQQTSKRTESLLQILQTNYRNTPEVTRLANLILKIKQNRFGSIDRESNYLVESNSKREGQIHLLNQEHKLVQELNRKISHSTKFAVIVMHETQKNAARQQFGTPLVFSIQEAKGLEYDNIILYNFVSDDEMRFKEITRGVMVEDLQEALVYRRAKDKRDKSLEIYKFHINALYVAITRAVENLYWIEKKPKQALFKLLQLELNTKGFKLEQQRSSNEEWQQEASRLEQQGKQEQAQEIRQQILKQQVVPWEVLNSKKAQQLKESIKKQKNKKKMLTLFEYALLNQHQPYKNDLFNNDFSATRNEEKAFRSLINNHYTLFSFNNPQSALRQVEKYGIDHRDRYGMTPLMIASLLGNAALTEALIKQGANRELCNDAGLNSLQIALYQACRDKKYCLHKLSAIYPLLTPPHIDIQVENRMIRIGDHLMEFFLINLMMVMYYTHYAYKISYSRTNKSAFESGDFIELLEDFPETVLLPQRKKRAYISSILSKNERDNKGRYNRQLFMRTLRGHYMINSEMKLKIEGKWTPVYRWLQHSHIAFPNSDIPTGQAPDLSAQLARRIKNAQKILCPNSQAI